MAEQSTLARPYAKAAFEAAKAASALASWSDALATLAAVSLDDKVQKALGNPAATSASNVAILAELAPEAVAATKNLLAAMADQKRLGLLPDVVTHFEKFRADEEHSANVTITSAYALTATQEALLKEKLKNKLGRDVQLVTEVDATLIGGVVIRTNDMVIDGSVTGKLAKLAEAMYS
jgi:F-type H+-transporting ATPase subunit delta